MHGSVRHKKGIETKQSEKKELIAFAIYCL